MKKQASYMEGPKSTFVWVVIEKESKEIVAKIIGNIGRYSVNGNINYKFDICYYSDKENLLYQSSTHYQNIPNQIYESFGYDEKRFNEKYEIKKLL